MIQVKFSTPALEFLGILRHISTFYARDFKSTLQICIIGNLYLKRPVLAST